MNEKSFKNKVKEMEQIKPKLFALESDAKADIKEIENVEKYYDVVFPDSYKDFVKLYGGGYFGFVVIYSCDRKGMFYIKNNVSKEWVLEKSFFPVIDFETGDLLGFKVKNGKCQDTVDLYLHEEDDLREVGMDFYEALLKYGLECS